MSETKQLQFQHSELRDPAPALSTSPPVSITVENLRLYYGEVQALRGIDLSVSEKQVTAFIGPSGCGKSTLLRCFNRLNDLIEGCRVEGNIYLNGRDIMSEKIDVAALRREVGMVFQKPNPFPKTVYENVAYGLRIQGVNKRRILDDAMEWALRGSALWNEVKDRLNESAFGLSGGQQQRLVIARAIAVQPRCLPTPRSNERKTTSQDATADRHGTRMDTLNIGQHISQQFNEELEDVRGKVLQMGGIVEEQLEQAVRALVEGDPVLDAFARMDVDTAVKAFKADEKVDAKYISIPAS